MPLKYATVLDHGTDGDLSLREQFLDRIGQQVGRRMADHFQAIGVLGGHDGQRQVLVDEVAGINHLGILARADLAGQRGLGQARAYRCSHLGHGDRAGILALRTIGKRNVDHGIPKIFSRGVRHPQKAKKRGAGSALFEGRVSLVQARTASR
jgi:hypothetical protein